MSAVWLKIITALCVCCTALTDAAGDRGVVWRNVGEAVTIQCRTAQGSNFLSLNLKVGLSEDTDVFLTQENSGQTTVADRYTDRLQSNGAFPNVDILIRNLTLNDTGPYWCVYQMFDMRAFKIKSTKGDGSVLLVVTGDKRGATDQVKSCDPSHQDLVLVPVLISAVVLLFILIAFLITIILKLLCMNGPIRACDVQMRPPEQEEDL